MGIAPTGKRGTMTGTAIDRCQRGKLVEQWKTVTNSSANPAWPPPTTTVWKCSRSAGPPDVRHRGRRLAVHQTGWESYLHSVAPQIRHLNWDCPWPFTPPVGIQITRASARTWQRHGFCLAASGTPCCLTSGPSVVASAAGMTVDDTLQPSPSRCTRMKQSSLAFGSRSTFASSAVPQARASWYPIVEFERFEASQSRLVRGRGLPPVRCSWQRTPGVKST
jgi:hypothetical protein